VWLHVPLPEFRSAAVTGESTWDSTLCSAQLFARSCTARGKHSSPLIWSRRWKTASWMKLLSGAILPQSQMQASAITFGRQLGGASEFSSAESLVNLIPWPESSWVRQMIATFCQIFSSPSMRTIPNRSSSKTSQGRLTLAFSAESDTNWKEEATQLKQDYLARRKSARRIYESGFMSWPSAKVSRGGYCYSRGDHDDTILTLEGAAAMWATPQTPNGGRTLTPQQLANHGLTETGKRQVGLENLATAWATPTVWESRQEETSPADLHRKTPGLRAEAQLWATPKTSDTNGIRKDDEKRGVGLNTETANWATPRATDGEKGGPNQTFGTGGTPLPAMTASWPTPTTMDAGRVTKFAQGGTPLPMAANHCLSSLRAQDWVVLAWSLTSENFTDATLSELSDVLERNLPTRSDGSKSLKSPPTLRRRLNPKFVAWLMGIPIDWMNFGHLETESCPSTSRSHSLAFSHSSWKAAMRIRLHDVQQRRLSDPEYAPKVEIIKREGE